MSLPARRVVSLTAAATAASLIAAVVGVGLVGGGDNDPAPYVFETLEPSPPPEVTVTFVPGLTQDPSHPTQPADKSNWTPDPDATSPYIPDFVSISGFEIPIPDGADYSCCGGPGTRYFHWVWFGEPVVYDETVAGEIRGIWFDDNGLLYAHPTAVQDPALGPTLDALWALTQSVANESPEFVQIEGLQIPLPEGSFYTTEEGPADLNPVTYIVRLRRSAFMLDSNGLFNESIAPDDAAAFRSTTEAAATLADPAR